MSQKIPLYYSLPAIILSTLLAVAIIYAWTEPTETPPGGNVPTPINVGDDPQQKTGSLEVGGFISDYSSYLATLGGKVGIGTTVPSTKLHVVGGARITGLVSCNTIDTDASGNLTCGTDETNGGGGGAPTNASYVVMGLNPTLTSERVLVGGNGLTLTDSGAGGNATLNVGAGTGISVGADTVSLVDPTKNCNPGYAIQSFNLSSSVEPTCVAVGGGGLTSCRQVISSQVTCYYNIPCSAAAQCASDEYLTGGGYNVSTHGLDVYISHPDYANRQWQLGAINWERSGISHFMKAYAICCK